MRASHAPPTVVFIVKFVSSVIRRKEGEGEERDFNRESSEGGSSPMPLPGYL